MSSSWLPLYTHTAAATARQYPTQTKLGSYNSSTSRKPYGNTLSCRAASSITDFDLYDLLGIDSSSDSSRIKAAYRALQKQCHPDIAGPAGHDMSIILNEAYSLLSDPSSRLAYDKEQAKMAELRGYTGNPVYSVWLGSENEQRAVFVDEVKCIGCLKCALFAGKTFAVESVYGRARVVAQWADPEYKVMEAIQTCPVDCISMVEGSDLAALEFLMSKQPRGNVRVGMSNAAGERVSNIFTDVKKFQARFKEAMEKASKEHSKGATFENEAQLAAIQTIRSISNWLFWQTATPAGPGSKQGQNLTHIATKSTPEINRLQAAVTARKQIRAKAEDRNRATEKHIYKDDYWVPTTLALPTSTQTPNSTISKSRVETKPIKEPRGLGDGGHVSPMRLALPVSISIIATAAIQQMMRNDGASSLKEHIGGSMALELVNSHWMQVMLTGVTWYIIGMVVMGMVEMIGRKIRD
ncbi:Chaperone protein dnaJ C76, chloroplastic, partial [Cucurbita argyrosperma subsp. sororia]